MRKMVLNSISSQCHSSVYANGGVANTVVAVSVDDVAWRAYTRRPLLLHGKIIDFNLPNDIQRNMKHVILSEMPSSGSSRLYWHIISCLRWCLPINMPKYEYMARAPGAKSILSHSIASLADLHLTLSLSLSVSLPLCPSLARSLSLSSSNQ